MESPATAMAAEVADFVRKEVTDWDDDVKSIARFKAFSGQRSDWEPQFRFWRNLILSICRRFRILFLSPSQVKSWFDRGGLLPLCLDHVLLEMYKIGDLVRLADLGNPASGRLSQLLTKVVTVARYAGVFKASTSDVLDGQLIVATMLEDKLASIVKSLAECHWTSTCIITMSKFEELCGGQSEASVMRSYLSGCGRAKYFSVKKKDLIEGLKVSLSPNTVGGVTSEDCDILQLVWTAEKLQQQLDVIDQRYEMTRKSALASLKEGNRNAALRHARALKLDSKSREKLVLLMNRVDEVLRLIADAESTKQVSEAIQIAGKAMKENKVDIEQLDQSLHDLDEAAYTQKQINDVLGSTTDDDLEEELDELESEVRAEASQVPASKSAQGVAAKEPEVTDSADSLAESLSALKLANGSGSSESASRGSKGEHEAA